jgi:adenylate cyclase
MNNRLRFQKKFLFGLFMVIFICITVELSYQFGWMNLPDNQYIDLWHQLAGIRCKPEHVIIVAIDDQKSLEHMDEPLVFWGPYFAKAIKVLRRADAKIIGVDFLFSTSAESWLNKLNFPGSKEASRTYDLHLREQLASGKVILAGNMVFDGKGRLKVLWPSWDLLLSLPKKHNDVGLTNFYSDPDGVIRHFLPVFSDDQGKVLGFSFAFLLAMRSSSEISEKDLNKIAPIGFIGPPGTIPRISFRELLQPGAERQAKILNLFKGKVVIIAYEPSEIQDIRMTPYGINFLGKGGQMMSGAELHANIVETLLKGRFPQPVGIFYRYLFWGIFFVASTFLFYRLSPGRGLAAGTILIMLCPLLAYLLFHLYLILPIAGLQFGIVLIYIGTLGLKLTGEERERKRLRQLFGRYVSEEIVEKLLTSGKRPDLGGEAVLVTVLFSDIRHFTTISERLQPHQVVDMLNTFFSRICEPILKHGGTVDKFDFGIPKMTPQGRF